VRGRGKEAGEVMEIFGVHFENSAVGYYRMWLPFDELNRQGLDVCGRYQDETHVSTVPITREAAKGGKLISLEEAAQNSSLMVWQRMTKLESISAMYGIREATGVPVIAECDDDLMNVQPVSNAYGKYRDRDPLEDLEVREIPKGEISNYKDRRDGILEERDGKWFFITKPTGDARPWGKVFLQEADGITTTTEYLANEFRKFNPYVYVLPNCLDVPRWERARLNRKKWDDGTIHFGWFGGMQHYDDLKLIREVVPELLEKYPNLVFHMTLMQPDFWIDLVEHPRFVHHDYAPIQKWPEFLASIGLDFALAPLNTAKFNLSKSNVKLLEYGALGIPCIYSPVGPYTEVVDGETGFLASTKQEWLEKASILVESSIARMEVSNRALKYVTERYDIRKWAGEWHKTYEEVYNRSRKMRAKAADRNRRRLMNGTKDIQGNLSGTPAA